MHTIEAQDVFWPMPGRINNRYSIYDNSAGVAARGCVLHVMQVYMYIVTSVAIGYVAVTII